MTQQKKSKEEEGKQEKLGFLGRTGDSLLKIKNVVERVKNSRAVKIITSPAVVRGISIASALAGITVGRCLFQG